VNAITLPTPTQPATVVSARMPQDVLGPGGRRWLTGAVLLAHLAGACALLQVDAVRVAVSRVAPTLMVEMITLDPAPKATPPPPPQSPRPRTEAPAPTPLIAAAPSQAPTAPSFTVPAPEPAPPAPVLAAPVPPAPLAPSAAPAVQTPPPAPALKKIPGSALRYQTLPRLNFPLLSRRAHESGEVVLRIVVDASGQLKDAWVQKSSGFARIDQAALQDIRSARFMPYVEDGRPVDVESAAVLAYDLDR
jgi:periplasmic protein TonB